MGPYHPYHHTTQSDIAKLFQKSFGVTPGLFELEPSVLIYSLIHYAYDTAGLTQASWAMDARLLKKNLTCTIILNYISAIEVVLIVLLWKCMFRLPIVSIGSGDDGLKDMEVRIVVEIILIQQFNK